MRIASNSSVEPNTFVDNNEDAEELQAVAVVVLVTLIDNGETPLLFGEGPMPTASLVSTLKVLLELLCLQGTPSRDDKA